ncbi:hypothetical protein [Microvirga flavescens]|uniref:hypothetical protein n=1 Tax=Microvirga flavescens TaxID=2249811 RepID=UPI00130028BE|nr:hypothetical protein [Microvirga flavescens]
MRRTAILLSLLSGLGLLAAPAAAETFERTVKMNTPSAIGGFLGYEVDTCYAAAIPDVKVRQEPSNGSFRVIPHEQALSKDTRCAGKKVRGLAYVYTPKKGFKGLDEVQIDVPWHTTDSGPQTVWTYTFRIRVE